MLELVLTRHGHTDRSEPEQYLGQRVVANLTERGRAQARALGERLQEVPFDRVIASPLTRARETAALILPDAVVEPDPRLAEQDYGDWEGRTVDEIRHRWPELRRRWETDPGSLGPPNGESGEQLGRRLRALLVELEDLSQAAGATEARRVLLVGHSSVNRVLLCVCLGVSVGAYRRRFRQDWANLTVLRWLPEHGDGWLAVRINDVSHLPSVPGEL